MLRKAICIILIACFLFQIRCATTKTLPVVSEDYDKLKEEKEIFVTVKSGQEYELIEFEITDTHIIGNSITKDPDSQIILSKEKIEIKLEDIELILVKKTEVTAKGILIPVAIVSLIAIIAAAVLGSSEPCAT